MTEVESDKGFNVYCKKCRGQVEWQECLNCEEGYSYHNCGEDTCACLNAENNVQCDVCNGNGGWWKCHSCESKEK